MGNRLCKKKSDVADNGPAKSTTPFERIINRIHLRSNRWKSDSHLNQKQVTSNSKNDVNKSKQHPFSKSSDWTEPDLEVPENGEAELCQLRNPKLELIFNDNNTPTPPPRKHKKRGIREAIESVMAKNGLQVFQSNRADADQQDNKTPVEEPLFVKKTINPTCPVCDHDCTIHNRDHKHQSTEPPLADVKLRAGDAMPTKLKRRKNLSVISLPNYNELKLTMRTFDDIDKKVDPAAKGSLTSLPNESKKLSTSASTGKLEIYMTRCRSFGSLLPQQLREKLRVKKILPAHVDSDDSSGALEDWDLGLIEHYNPKEASLPRARAAPRSDKEVLDDIAGLIVKDDDVPARKSSDELLTKTSKNADESFKREQFQVESQHASNNSSLPMPRNDQDNIDQRHSNEAAVVEHSSLIKILEKFSIKDKQQQQQQQTGNNDVQNESKQETFDLNKNGISINEFLSAEREHCLRDRPLEAVQT